MGLYTVLLCISMVTLTLGALPKYTFHKGSKTWADARRECRFNSGDLVDIESAEELRTINSRARAFEADVNRGARIYNYWTRGHGRDRKFYWGSGSEIITMSGIWGQGEPNNYAGSDEKCVSLHTDRLAYGDYRLWVNDETCHYLFSYICEYD